jgi:hypothetical protein
MNFPDKGLMLDSIKGSVATAALFLAYILLPLAGILPGLFAPLPGMYYSLKSGKPVGFAIVLISAAIIAVTANPMAMMLYLIQGGLISLALPHFLAKGWGGNAFDRIQRSLEFFLPAPLCNVCLAVQWC